MALTVGYGNYEQESEYYVGKARELKQILEEANVPIGEIKEGPDGDQTWDGMGVNHDNIITGTEELPNKADTDASDYIKETVFNSNPKELTIIMLGTLTNLATAMERYLGGAEAFQQKVKKIYVVAGGVEDRPPFMVPGNVVDKYPPFAFGQAEWNVWRDKKAADYVLRKAIETGGEPKIEVIPLDATMDTVITTYDVTNTMERAGTTITNYTTPILRWWLNLNDTAINPIDPITYVRWFNWFMGGFWPYDTIGMAIALNESLATRKENHTAGVEWITGKMKIHDFFGNDFTDRQNVTIIYDFDTDIFNSKVLELLTKPDNPRPSGGTITVCKDGSCDYRKIKDAIIAANYGDLIEVRDQGTYYEDIVEIQGNGITLNCNGAIVTPLSSGYACIGIWGSNNTIKNCEIKDCRRGIAIIGIGPSLEDHTYGNKLISNEIHDTQIVIFGDGDGIEIKYSDNVIIKYNNIKSNTNNGIYADYTEFSNIEDNTIENNDGYGVYIANSKYQNTIQDNSIKNNSDKGIRLHQSDYDVIGSNFIEYNKDDGIYTVASDYVKINNNVIKHNSKDGIDIGGYYNIILDNLISDNGRAIYTTSYGDIIMENEIWLNDYGVYVDTFHMSKDPVNDISYNDLCYHGTSNTNTDIYLRDPDTSFGDENTCSTTYNFDDNGTSGCTYSCSGCECNSGVCCDGCHYYPLGTLCGIDKECGANGDCVAKTKNINLFLSKGWNLISVPLILGDNSVASVFAGLSYSELFYYDNGWKFPIEIDNTKGYWIKMDNADTLTVEGLPPENTLILNTGWNLIGPPYLEQKNIAELLDNARVYMYNNSKWYSYDPNKPSQLNTLTRFIPGHGYWIKK